MLGKDKGGEEREERETICVLISFPACWPPACSSEDDGCEKHRARGRDGGSTRGRMWNPPKFRDQTERVKASVLWHF